MNMAARPIGGELHGKLHRMPVRVYYEDTDAGGVAYHALNGLRLILGDSGVRRPRGVNRFGRAVFSGRRSFWHAVGSG